MMIKNRILPFFSLILMIISCKENTSRSLGKLNNEHKISQDKILSFEFPDTVQVNKLINGGLKYNTDLEDSNFEERNIFLYVSTNQKKERESLEKMIESPNLLIHEDTIGNGQFSFQAVFTKTGKSYLHCLVQDIVFLNEEAKKSGTGAIINETDLNKRIYVIQDKE